MLLDQGTNLTQKQKPKQKQQDDNTYTSSESDDSHSNQNQSKEMTMRELADSHTKTTNGTESAPLDEVIAVLVVKVAPQISEKHSNDDDMVREVENALSG